jgi:hypothetical protein
MTGHVAQLNIGQLWYPLDDPRSAEFVDNTGRVNAIADRSPGFVWRCEDEAASLAAEGIRLYDGDPCALATLSVWDSAAALEHFVLRTVHGAFLKRRATWFRPQAERTYVIWPTEAGRRPTFAEGLARLDLLRAKGPSGDAHDFEFLRATAQTGASL